MNKNIALVIYGVLAVLIIGFGAWWVDTVTMPQAPAGQVESSTQTTQTQNSTSTNNNMDTLKIVDTTVGTGATAENGDTVTVNYTGTLDNGTKFDSSLNPGRTPFSFTIGATGPGSVIAGWNQGVVGMKVGGTRELTIPPDLGYGANANGPIPANSTLHFTITLLSVTSSAATAQ